MKKSIIEVSKLIVCPHCRQKSPKSWTTTESLNNGIITRTALFTCMICSKDTEINDEKLKQFIFDYQWSDF